MTNEEMQALLEQKLHANYSEYINDWLKLEPTYLVEQAESIAVVKQVFGSLTSTEYTAEQMEYLLSLDDPLAAICKKFEEANDNQYFLSVDSVVDEICEQATYDKGVQMC